MRVEQILAIKKYGHLAACKKCPYSVNRLRMYKVECFLLIAQSGFFPVFNRAHGCNLFKNTVECPDAVKTNIKRNPRYGEICDDESSFRFFYAQL